VSDSAPLHRLVADMLAASNNGVRCMRDPTRGGFPARSTKSPGLDPLYVANEGKLLAIVSPEAADEILRAMRQDRLGAEAAIIGTVGDETAGLVTMKTAFGSTRIVDMLAGEQLPRIC
jgi:hydrogenase expression/formation protein HypE